MAVEGNAGAVIVTSDPDVVAKADRIVLPGDGAFPHCKNELFSRTALAEAIIDSVTKRAVPFMGICVGMQMLATTGMNMRKPLALAGSQAISARSRLPTLRLKSRIWAGTT